MSEVNKGLATSEMWLGTAAAYGCYEVATRLDGMAAAVAALGLAMIASVYTYSRARTKARNGGAA